MTFEQESAFGAAFAVGALALGQILFIVGCRTVQIMSGKKQPGGFGKSRNETENSLYGRVSNSHANLMESLPIFYMVVVTNALVDGSPDISSKAWWYAMARFSQAIMHWTSVSPNAVTIRFIFFMTSLGLIITMALETMGIALM